jgi:hypothetical protein
MTNGTSKWKNGFGKLQLIVVVAVKKQSKSITPNSDCEGGIHSEPMMVASFVFIISNLLANALSIPTSFH